MDPDDILDALDGIQDTIDDARGQLERLRHRLTEDRGNPDERDLIRDHREASR